MNLFFSILVIVIIIGFFNTEKGQRNLLFAPHEINLLNFKYTPLYATYSEDISHLMIYRI